MSFVEFPTDKGHDAFLLDEPDFHRTLAGFLRRLRDACGAAVRGSSRDRSMTTMDPVRFLAKNMRVDLALIAGMIEPNTRVLDIGCGDGTLIDHLFQTKGCDARGIEIDMAEVTHAVAHGLPVMHGDADIDLAHYPDGAFDYVVLSRALQAVEKPREVLRADAAHRHPRRGQFPEFRPLAGALAVAFVRPHADDQDLGSAWYETPNIHPCTIRDFFALCDQEGYEVETWLAADEAGRRGPWRRFSWMANLFGEQGVFLLRRR